MKVYIETYGCAANVADTEVMKTMLEKAGVTLVDSLEDADVIVVNTCTVRRETEEKMLKRIRQLSKLSKKLVVAGCMAKAQPGLVFSVAPKASLISPQQVERILEVVKADARMVLLGGRVREGKMLPEYREGAVYTLAVADGCLGECAYCIVKRARGDLRSFSVDSLVAAVSRAVERGAREVRLTAQDLAAYGRDLGENLVRLLAEMRGVKGEFRVRLGMMNPDTAASFFSDLVALLKEEPRFYKYLHMPVQSGDNRVLRLMRRRYTVELFEKLVRELRRELPMACLATDVIVGFPGEDEEAFENTCRLLERVQPDKVHIARYSVRPHTLAATYPQLPEPVKKRRSQYLTELVAELTLKRNLEFVGREEKALLVEVKGEGAVGRLDNYKPVVVRNVDAEAVLGKFADVVIEEAAPIYLVGRAVSLH